MTRFDQDDLRLFPTVEASCAICEKSEGEVRLIMALPQHVRCFQNLANSKTMTVNEHAAYQSKRSRIPLEEAEARHVVGDSLLWAGDADEAVGSVALEFDDDG